MWNIPTLFQAGELDNVLVEMDRMKINCLGLCEVSGLTPEISASTKKLILYPGGDQHHHGVGLVLDKRFANSVLYFLATGCC